MITHMRRERVISLFILLSIFFEITPLGFAQREFSPKGAERIISISPGITSSMIYLGYGDKVVGVTDYDRNIISLKESKSVGSMFSPNVEKIVYMKPDYVIFQSHYEKRLVSQLEKMGIGTLKLESPKNIEDILLSLEKIISIFPEDFSKERAELKLAKLKSEVEERKKIGQGIEKRPKIFFFLGFGHHIYTAGRETFIDDIIAAAGGVNIVEEKGWSYPLEALIVQDPDYILTSSHKWENIKKDSRFARLSAVRENKVILIDDNLITLPTPDTLTKGLEIIQKAVLDFNLRK